MIATGPQVATDRARSGLIPCALQGPIYPIFVKPAPVTGMALAKSIVVSWAVADDPLPATQYPLTVGTPRPPAGIVWQTAPTIVSSETASFARG